MIQGDMSAIDYCHKIKTLADALGDVGQTVSDAILALTMIRGMNPKYGSLATLLPLITPFPSFIQARSHLILEETKHAYIAQISNAIALVANSLFHQGGAQN